MNRFSRLLAIVAIAGTATFYAGTASAFFGFDDWFDPWDDGPYYGYPGYGYGGVFCLDLETADRAQEFMDVLQNEEKFGFIAVSLGYFDTLMSLSAGSTSSEMGEEGLAEAGISPGLIRVSIGYTGSLEQRWKEFENALQKAELG